MGLCGGQGVSIDVKGLVLRSRDQCGGQGVSVEVKGSVITNKHFFSGNIVDKW